MDIDFHSKYINIDFDKLLIDNNNPLVNSEDIFLNFKKQYFDETILAYNEFQELSKRLKELQELGGYKHNSKGTKHLFVYIDTERIESLKIKIKNLYITQEKRFSNFYNYVILLNTNPDLFIEKPKVVEKRSFLSKLFDKKV
jgi:uncharacterized protein YlbG (UPF0298 family)